MRVKLILPALVEAKTPRSRSIKYSLFPPLGLATLAGFLGDDDEVELIDDHVEAWSMDDRPDLVVIQVYITSARRSYAIADAYRAKGCHVALGGLHVTSLPDEAARHADTIFLGPGEQTFPDFLADFRRGRAKARYVSTHGRRLDGLPSIRRDLIKRSRYLVPNSLVVSRGCPHHCSFCYKDAFFQGGKSFYVQRVDDALAEIDRLPGRHLYFLDDHLFGAKKFARTLFSGMAGMNRVWQAAATVDSILDGDLIERAAASGLRSLFVGFESLSPMALANSNKKQNLSRNYDEAIRRLHDLGIMINASFVFGIDGDGRDVFARTVDWAVSQGITTATFHIQTPYPGTALYRQMSEAGRILHRDWDRYDTRHTVFRPRGMGAEELEAGYWRAYRDFYSWRNIRRAAMTHDQIKHAAKHLAYTIGWKKAEWVWSAAIRSGALGAARPLLEAVLSKINRNGVVTSPHGARDAAPAGEYVQARAPRGE